MIQIDMSASKRESFGKGAMRRLRGSGNTPAILYGNDKNVVPLQLETATFLKGLFQINRKNAVVNLSVADGDTRHVMVKEIQTDPVNDSLIHADFHEIDLQKPGCFTVAIDYTGKARGEALGGEVVVYSSKVQLEGIPLEIPDVLSVDLSPLEVGDSIRFADIMLPENVKMTSKDSTMCVEVISATAAAAAAAVAATVASDAAADAADAAADATAEETPAEGTDTES